MTKIVAVANQKGGVGKTTTAVNLAAAVQEGGARTLLVDFDPQGNATSGYGVAKRDGLPTVYDALSGRAEPSQAVRKTPYGDILPSNLELAGAELELIESDGREYRLKDTLSPLAGYDFIFIDCPPSLGLLTINALCAADSVLIPLQCEYYALEGLSMLVSTIRSIRKRLNPSLDIEGILFTMYDGRTNLSASVVSEVKRHFSDRIYKTVITRNVRLSEAPSHGKPIMHYDRLSKGNECYTALASEFLMRQKTAKGVG